MVGGRQVVGGVAGIVSSTLDGDARILCSSVGIRIGIAFDDTVAGILWNLGTLGGASVGCRAFVRTTIAVDATRIRCDGWRNGQTTAAKSRII